ncbi:hypothetical protein CMQ_6812 [Grosmannia clavigera kw1407]|uniref:Uncharacterized protein n=1 Tax=Grosmannia clavigera (strain kw1407 / UAMH 11150) TaxID=655863 RepID=F0X7C3_GROCL|nr:uncharacterized protein CMQ_6812 [Grosmannia clavigera kw1407]EFX06491.1 hypothetical protein CMQ_6812 [Grosmannia clavigera kw1407]
MKMLARLLAFGFVVAPVLGQGYSYGSFNYGSTDNLLDLFFIDDNDDNNVSLHMGAAHVWHYLHTLYLVYLVDILNNDHTCNPALLYDAVYKHHTQDYELHHQLAAVVQHHHGINFDKDDNEFGLRWHSHNLETQFHL